MPVKARPGAPSPFHSGLNLKWIRVSPGPVPTRRSLAAQHGAGRRCRRPGAGRDSRARGRRPYSEPASAGLRGPSRATGRLESGRPVSRADRNPALQSVGRWTKRPARARARDFPRWRRHCRRRRRLCLSGFPAGRPALQASVRLSVGRESMPPPGPAGMACGRRRLSGGGVAAAAHVLPLLHLPHQLLCCCTGRCRRDRRAALQQRPAVGCGAA